MPNYLEDSDFLDSLLTLICRNEKFLRLNGHMLKSEDFKPVSGVAGGRDRWLIASKALEHWTKYREPVADTLQAELKEHAELSKLNDRRKRELRDYARDVLERTRVSAKSITEKVRHWKREVALNEQIAKLQEEQAEGKLTSSRFLELARQVVTLDAQLDLPTSDFLGNAALEARIQRRHEMSNTRFLPLLIDPLDLEIRAIARGQLGLILAPYKRGKSLMLIHLALSYAIQRLRVLYITLEDPLREVEDRFDALITGIPLKELEESPNRLRSRIRSFASLVSGRFRIVDRVEEGCSVAEIEQLWLKESENDFKPDVVIVDYDDEITPETRNKERRHEFAQIYRDLRRFAARNNIIVWTACQTQRGTGDVVKLSGEAIAEDISKVRKVALAIGIGKAEKEFEEHGESVHLFIAAHKFDRQNIGWNIACDRASAKIYDREKTYQIAKIMAQRGLAGVRD